MPLESKRDLLGDSPNLDSGKNMSLDWASIRQWNRKPSQQRSTGSGECIAEPFGWLFVDFVPLLYEKKRVARQLQVETWLDLYQLVKELGIEKLEETKRDAHLTMSYIV